MGFLTIASDFAQREAIGDNGSLDIGEGKPTVDPQMLLRLPAFTGVFELFQDRSPSLRHCWSASDSPEICVPKSAPKIHPKFGRS